MKVWDIVQPKYRWQATIASINHAITGIKTYGDKRVDVKYVEMDELIDVYSEHYCDMRDYPEVCEQCYENHIDGLQQFQEDNYRDR